MIYLCPPNVFPGDIDEAAYVSGLIGADAGGDITNLISRGDVTSFGRFAGGLVGAIGDADITNSHSTGDVTSAGFYAGGLAGLSNATISHSYSTGLT